MAKVKSFILLNDSLLDNLLSSVQVSNSGGFAFIGDAGNWAVVLVTTTDARMDTLLTAAGNNALELVRFSTDERQELDASFNSTTLTKLNVWLVARGFPTEVNGQNVRPVLRRLAQRFLPDFEPEKWDIN